MIITYHYKLISFLYYFGCILKQTLNLQPKWISISFLIRFEWKCWLDDIILSQIILHYFHFKYTFIYKLTSDVYIIVYELFDSVREPCVPGTVRQFSPYRPGTRSVGTQRPNSTNTTQYAEYSLKKRLDWNPGLLQM